MSDGENTGVSGPPSKADHAAFEALYEEHYAPLIQQLVRESVTEEQAENCVQQVLVEILDRASREGRLPEMHHPFQYLLRAARNRLNTDRKDAKRFCSFDNLAPAADAIGSGSVLGFADVAADPTMKSPPSQIAHAEALRELEEACAALDPSDREIVRLWSEGLEIPQIAGQLGLNLAAAQKRLKQVHKKIRQALSPQHSSLPGESRKYWTPRTRDGALVAILSVSKPYFHVVYSQYILLESEEDAVRRLAISPAVYRALLEKGHEILAKTFDFPTAEALVTALARKRNAPESDHVHEP